jgi:hypothetical protein
VATGRLPVNGTAAIQSTIVDAAGDLIIGTGADAVGRLGIGTAGQVLAVNSGATAPEWITPAAGGAPVQLATTSLAGVATFTFSGISTAYKTLYIELVDSFDNSQEPVNLTINGSTAANYDRLGLRSNSSTLLSATAGTSWTLGDNGASTSSRSSFYITLPNYAKTNIRKSFFGYFQQPGNLRWNTGHNTLDAIRDAAITSITLTNNAVNWVGGTLTIYGEL